VASFRVKKRTIFLKKSIAQKPITELDFCIVVLLTDHYVLQEWRDNKGTLFWDFLW
jgi:hypothetical protein